MHETHHRFLLHRIKKGIHTAGEIRNEKRNDDLLLKGIDHSLLITVNRICFFVNRTAEDFRWAHGRHREEGSGDPSVGQSFFIIFPSAFSTGPSCLFFVFRPKTHEEKYSEIPYSSFRRRRRERRTEKAPGPAGRGALSIEICQDQYTQISEMQVS